MPSIVQSPLVPPGGDPPAPGLFTQAHIDTPYGTYSVITYFMTTQGKAACPLGKASGAAGPSNVVIDLHAPVTKKIVEWQATRSGLQPKVPTATPSDANLVLLENPVWLTDEKLSTDGRSPVYGIAGRYVYACLSPVQESDGFPLAFTPYRSVMDSSGNALQGNAAREIFASSNFVDGIVG